MFQRLLLALLLLSIPLLAAPTTGDITLRLKDARQRPVPNASVAVTYTVTDPLFGELQKTDVFYSDRLGIARKRITADYNTPYTITVNYHELTYEQQFNWLGTTDRYLNLPLNDFGVKTYDSDGNPIPNVPLRIEVDNSTIHSSTNASGIRMFSQYNTQKVYNIYARYGSREYLGRLVPNNNIITITIPTYSVEIRAIDDNGNSVFSEMNVTYLGVANVTRRHSGIVGLFTQIPEGNVTAELFYSGRRLSETFYVNESGSRTFVFDLTPPNVSVPVLNPPVPVPENDVEISVNVTDPGRNATGMPEVVNMIPPVELYYSLDGATWLRTYMFPQPPDNVTYIGRVPGQPRDSVVRYYIVAVDRAGNRVETQRYAFNTFLNVTPTPTPLLPPVQDLSQYWWVAALAALALAAYYIKKRYF